MPTLNVSTYEAPVIQVVDNRVVLTLSVKDQAVAEAQRYAEEAARYSAVVFSDSIDATNARITTGPDGLDVITNATDRFTGEQVSLKEYTGVPPVTDGILFKLIGDKYYLRAVPMDYSLKMFGAKGNSVTDDTAAFQLALTTIEAVGGGTIGLGTGVFPVSQGLTNFNRITLKGGGPAATTLQSNITDGSHLINAVRNEALTASFHTYDMTFKGNGTLDGYAIHATRFVNSIHHNCHFDDFGGGAIKIIGTSNVTLHQIYARACGDNPSYSELDGVIHADRDVDFNNTLNGDKVYISNCNRLSGVFIGGYACRLVDPTIESCHTLLRIGKSWGNYYDRFSSISIFGLYFENPRNTALYIEQARNVLIDGMFVGGNQHTQFTPIVIKNSDNIEFKCADLEHVGWDIDTFSHDITVNGFGILPRGIGGVNDPLNSTEIGLYAGATGRAQNLIPYSNDFSQWLKSGAPTVVQQNGFVDGGINWELSKAVSTESVYVNIDRAYPAGEEMNASVYVFGRCQIRLLGRRVSDGVNAEVVRGQNVEQNRWRRMNVSFTADQEYDRMSFRITPQSYGTPSGSVLVAKAQFAVGSLEPGPYTENNGSSMETVVAGAFNGPIAVMGKAVGYSPAPPSTGKHNIGDRYFNTDPSNGISYWECVATGTPGTWEPSYRTDVILSSPDGTKWKMGVSDAGVTTWTAI